MSEADDTEYLKLPTIQKVQHKLWKARVCGYEEATKCFHQLTDPKDPEFQKYAPLMKKFVTDTNAAALDKALPAVLAFVENSAFAGKVVQDIVSGLIAKCLGAPKAKTRELSLEIILMCIEIEKQAIVQEELIKGLESKNPKIVAGIAMCMYECLRLFGPKVFPVKPLLKPLPKFLEDRDKGVREEGKRLAVEMYRWFGEAIKPQLIAGLKPVQISDLESGFEQVSGTAAAERYIRSEQERLADGGGDATAGEDGDDQGGDTHDGNAVSSLDPFDLLEPVDILSKLPKDFFTQIESKKWQERKEVLDKLHEALTAAPKIEPQGDYGDLVRALKKLVGKDANVVIVAEAAQCVHLLAQGLRNKFAPYASAMLPTLLEKLKEKKPNVLTALRDALDSTMKAMSLDNAFEDIVQCLGNKNPGIKSETAAFVARIFARSPATALQKKATMKPIVTQLLATLNDSDPSVRDSSAMALGTLLKVLGERQMGPYLADVDQLKMAKIKECCEKAVVVAVAATAAAPKAAAKPAVAAPPAASKSKPAAAATTVTKAASAPAKRRTFNKAETGSGGGGSSAKESAVHHEQVLSDEDVTAQLAAISCSDDVIGGLSNSNWKERLAAAEQFKQLSDALENDQIPVQAIIRFMLRKPGLKETNVQVLKVKMETVVSVLERGKVSLHTVDACLADLVDKVGDLKCGQLAQSALSALAEKTTLQHVAHEALNIAFQQRNPKVQSETLLWLSTAVKEFGLKMPLKPVIEHLKAALSASNPAVRSAAVSCFGVLYIYAGAPLRGFFDGEKPTVLAMLDAEVEKVSGETPPAPTRGLQLLQDQSGSSSVTSSSSSAAAATAASAAAHQTAQMEDLFPRQNIGEQLSGSIITELGDKNWKVRQEALQKIQTIITQAKFITPDIGDLGPALKQRIEDTNKNLAVQAIVICQQLIDAMGPNGSRHLRSFAPSMLAVVGDSKANVRAAAVECINLWVKHCGLNAFFEGDMLFDALNKENPFARIELFQWLTEQLSVEGVRVSHDDLTTIIQPLFHCLEDRNANVRKNALECVTPLMKILGYKRMLQRTLKLKASSRTVITKHLDAVKETIPVVKEPPPAASSHSAPPVARKTMAKPAPDSDIGGDTGSEAVAKKPVGGGTMVRGKGAAAPPTMTSATRKAKEEEEAAASHPTFVQNNLKTERIQQEKAMRIRKWQFQAPREEHISELKDLMQAAGMSALFLQYGFHSDFKFHLKALDMMIQRLDDDFKSVQDNSDLLFKWVTLRFFETNPSVVLKALEFLSGYFTRLGEREGRITIEEHNALVPFLLLKLGDNKDPVRKGVRDILHSMWLCDPPSRIFQACLAQLASKTKNARLNAEILEELALMINEHSLTVCVPDARTAVVQMARHISDRDNSIRSNALDAVASAYFLDESLKKIVDETLGPKELSYLEERIKRLSKNRPQTAPQTPVVNTDTITRVAARGTSTITRPRTAAPSTTVKQQSSSAVAPPTVADDGGSASLNRRAAPQPDENQPFVQQNHHSNILRGFDLDEQNDILRKAAELLKYSPKMPSAVARRLADVPLDPDTLESIIRRGDFQDVMDALLDCQQLSMDLASGRVVLADEEPLRRLTKTLVDVYDDCLRSHRHSQPPQDVSNCVDRLTHTLSQFAHCAVWTRCMNVDACQHILRVAVLTVTDESMSSWMPQSADRVKSLNRLALDIITRCDRLVVLTALVKLMYLCYSTTTNESKTAELVMKCIWKSLKTFEDAEGGADETLLRGVLLEMDKLFVKFPSSFWKQLPTEMPYRTLKTVLYTLLKVYGNQALRAAQQLPCKSALVSFLERIHDRVSTECNTNTANNDNNHAERDRLNARFTKLLEQHCLEPDNMGIKAELEMFVTAYPDYRQDLAPNDLQDSPDYTSTIPPGAFPPEVEVITRSRESAVDFIRIKCRQYNLKCLLKRFSTDCETLRFPRGHLISAM